MRASLLLSLLSLIMGAAAAGVAATWLVASFVSGYPGMPLPTDLADVEALMQMRRLAIAFEVALPIAAAVAVFSGVPSWRQPAAKAGVLSGLAALAVFAAALAIDGHLP